MSEAEIRHLRDELNGSGRDYDLSQTAPAMIAARAAQRPEAPAIADEAASLTYGELNARASQIARRLVAAGIRPGGRVAIAMDRTVQTVAAMIGAWRAGCAYVPLDMTMPSARLRQILDAADITAILSDATSRTVLEAGPHRVFDFETLAGETDDRTVTLPTVTDADSAYVIFTSGSTGQPKGVEISHRALSNFLLSMAEAPGFTAQDKIIAVTTLSFDISGLELFLPLVIGGQTFIAGYQEVRTGYELLVRLNEQAATMLQATPSLWRMLLEGGFKAPRGFKILCGGEALPRDLADALLATGAEVWNVYGPTETTIWSAASRIAASGPVVIGAPIANTDLHVLTEDLHLAPLGVSGDLWIGGEGLAKGYFNRPDLTEAAFRNITIEGATPRRLYRTGDLARRLADGSIQVLGRRDHQIKLRGFRIEIEEIEVTLRKAPGVVGAAVALHTINDSPKLVGYIVKPVGSEPELTAVAEYAAAHLPSYMVPSLWVKLDALPQTQNGKLDRKALVAPQAGEIVKVDMHPAVPPQAASPALAPSAPQSAAPDVAMTPKQAAIAAIWCDVLGIPEIGVDQRFFSLGADSLQLFRIVARMNDRGLGVDARQLMKNVTIAELAASLDGESKGTVSEPTAVARPSILDFKRRSAQRI
jgi:amino acid adenylation domain-containing protein